MFGLNYLIDIKNYFLEILPNLIYSIFIFLLFLVIANVINYLLVNKIDKTVSNSIIIEEFGLILYYLIVIIGFIIAIINLGVQTATIITILGTFAIGLGLSVKSTIDDIIAGIYICSNNLFNIGDQVKIGETVGTIANINLFYTVINQLRTGLPIMIHNSKIKESIIINYYKYEYVNVENIFSISNIASNYKNYEQIFSIIKESLLNCKYIVNKNKITIGVLNASEGSGTAIVVLSPIKSIDWLLAYLEINSIVREALYTNGIILRLF
jgi:small conductance mechanosensitive channel